MGVTQAQLQCRLSGGPTNKNPFSSLGGAISSEQVKDDARNNLLDDISITELSTGHTDYFCFYVINTNGVDTFEGGKIWFTVMPIQISMGLGTSAVGGTEQVIATQTTQPGSVQFTQPLTINDALNLGNLTPGSWKAVWIRRIFPAGLFPQSDVFFRVKIEGDDIA
jgi:hypothetical protein